MISVLKDVPNHLARDDDEAMAWLADKTNRESLTEFLASYDLDINDVQEIWFFPLYFRAEVVERDSDGKLIVFRENVKVSTRKINY